jgi:colanic acid/amylovoran biosynthesis glycosyltransferase
MRLAVFTSQFPGRINTFFARDVRGLIDAGVDVEVFVVYPLESELWAFVPEILSEGVLPRTKVHHMTLGTGVMRALGNPQTWAQLPSMAAVACSAMPHGPQAALKSAYVMPKALGWARDHGGRFDHVLSYWGNYSATCAYLFHRASGQRTPFSTFLHAGTDLYRSRVYLPQKLHHADNIIVVCEFNREFLKNTYPSLFEQWAPKIYVHHLGVDLHALQYSRSNRAPNRLVAVGGLHPGKGFDDLLRAVAELKRRGRDTKTVIVGGGPEGPSLVRLTQQLGLESDVEFMGWQSPEGATAQIARATVLVQPSIGLGDAVPTVIKEAMALGTPVVASAVAGIPELLDEGRCGILSPPRQPTALAGAIATLLAAPDLGASYAIAARARAEQIFDARRNGASLAERLRRTRRHPVVARVTDPLVRRNEPTSH